MNLSEQELKIYNNEIRNINNKDVNEYFRILII